MTLSATLQRTKSHSRNKRQFYYCRVGQPQIILRQERLEQDIQIVAQLAPKQFKGLGRTNSASDHDRASVRASDLVTNLTPKSRKHFNNYYGVDFIALGYSQK